MKFKSKKNNVYLMDNRVHKSFLDKEGLINELHIMKLLEDKNLAVPQIISVNDKEIIYETVEGKVYAEIIDEITMLQVQSLILWMIDFHKITNSSHPDVNLRNFIWSKDCKCVGLDFEEGLLPLEPEKDLGKILAFALTYDPVFSVDKIKFGRLFIKECENYSFGIDKIKKEYIREIENMSKRRLNINFTLNEAIEFWELLF